MLAFKKCDAHHKFVSDVLTYMLSTCCGCAAGMSSVLKGNKIWWQLKCLVDVISLTNENWSFNRTIDCTDGYYACGSAMSSVDVDLWLRNVTVNDTNKFPKLIGFVSKSKVNWSDFFQWKTKANGYNLPQTTYFTWPVTWNSNSGLENWKMSL